MLQLNLDAVRQTLEILHSDSKCFEIRILDVKQGNYKFTHSGFFNSIEKAIEAIDIFEKSKFTYTGIYTTLNPVDDALLARSFNRIKQAKDTAADKNIVKRNWMLVDFDYDRPSGISTTDVEKESAKNKAVHVAEVLKKEGWPTPIIGDSGNGYHLLYKIDEPSEDSGLIEGVLNGLQVKFAAFEPKVKIDTGNFNAARISKLYGTPACKGDSTPERPHRVSQVFETDTTVVPTAQLQTLFIADKLNDADIKNKNEADSSAKWVTGWADNYGVELRECTSSFPYTWSLNCPFNSDHGHKNETQIYVFDSGAKSFKCQHESCSANKWKEFRKRIETTRKPKYNKPTVDTPEEPSFEDYRTDMKVEVKKIVNIGPLQKTGIPQLDECIGGIARGKFFILNGAPQAGKSAATTQMLTELTKNNYVVYYPVDEGQEELYKRMARHEGLDNEDMRFSHNENKVVDAVTKQCNHKNLFVIKKRSPLLTIEQVLKLAEHFKPVDLPLVVIIDSLHALAISDDQDNLRLFYTEMCSVVENWTKQTGGIFIGVVEQNRGGYAAANQKDRTLAMGTSAESRAFEFKADYLIVMNVDTNQDSPDDSDEFVPASIIKWTIAKIRGMKKAPFVFSKFDTKRTYHYPMTSEQYLKVKETTQTYKSKAKIQEKENLNNWLFELATFVIRNTADPITSLSGLAAEINKYCVMNSLKRPKTNLTYGMIRPFVEQWEKEKILDKPIKGAYKVTYEAAGFITPSDYKSIADVKAEITTTKKNDITQDTQEQTQ